MSCAGSLGVIVCIQHGLTLRAYVKVSFIYSGHGCRFLVTSYWFAFAIRRQSLTGKDARKRLERTRERTEEDECEKEEKVESQRERERDGERERERERERKKEGAFGGESERET